MIKKILKTTLIILLSIILLAVIFLLVVSHNTAFYRAVYPGIDDSMSDYPYMNETVPSDFVARTVHGITIKGPADCVNSSEGGSVPFKSDNFMVMVMSSAPASPCSPLAPLILFTYTHFAAAAAPATVHR